LKCHTKKKKRWNWGYEERKYLENHSQDIKWIEQLRGIIKIYVTKEGFLKWNEKLTKKTMEIS